MSARRYQCPSLLLRRGVSLVLGILCLGRANASTVPLTVSNPHSLSLRATPITSGVPFPIGALSTNTTLHLFDRAGKEVPSQTRVTATWRDGSVKWVLLDFQADLAAKETREFTLRSDERNGPVPLAERIQLKATPEALWINTGPLKFSISKGRFGLFEGRLQQSIALGREFSNITPRVLPPDEVRVEDGGPLHATIRVTGWIDDGRDNKLIQYLLRLHAFVGSSDVVIEHTVIQMNPRIKMLWVKDFSLVWTEPMSAVSGISGQPTNQASGGQPNMAKSGVTGNERTHDRSALEWTSLAPGPITLTQLKESSYTVAQAGHTNIGLRARGWFGAGGKERSIFVGLADFWQQFPKAITISTNGFRIGLYPAEAEDPLDMDQGVAKTHRVLISFHERPLTRDECEQKLGRLEEPLFAQAPIAWYCDSKVFGEVAPFNFDLFPDYETLTEASGDKFIKSMATGLRNWGDVYYGGPYKGKNSYMNLEYDVPHNFLVQFARTGQQKYLNAARRMAQHQADIDVNHFTKWQWKHSPRHTEIQAEFGHTFTRGLLENYFLTGNSRTLEAAVELGDYFSKQIRTPRETGNERQIGWGLISLLPVYEATWDKKYLNAARETVDRLVAGQDAKGKFNIRWDNRIAFFNGIAATGFIYYERATGDERAAEAALRTIRRTKGFYPEYAGRTLEALAWAYQRTTDPDYLDLLKLTYETTMARQIAWNTMELGAPTIFTVHTLPFLEKAGLMVQPAAPLNLTASQFASENGLYAHHIPAGSGDVYLRVDSTEPFQLVLVRKGAWKAAATAELFDSSGSLMQKWQLGREAKIWQRESCEVRPRQPGVCRLALRSATIENVRSGSYVTWDIATARAIPAVFQTPDFTGLQFVTPYLFTTPKGDTDKIEIDLVGEGEGFKKAVIYDPDGNAAGTLEAFVDLGDTGRYSYKMTAPIPARHRNGIWRLSLQEVSMTKLSGLLPYFATSEKAFFHPDRN